MKRKRSTFRPRRPMKFVNASYLAYEGDRQRRLRDRRREDALKKPGAKIAASEALGRADCERTRKAARRHAAYVAGLNGYHAYGRAQGSSYAWVRRATFLTDTPAETAKPKRSRKKAA